MNEFEKIYSKLNTEQKEAVDTLYGPVMVVAGPGTGKTQMLAIRIANILNKTDALPENILCLTFTEAGVKAMRERLYKFIGKLSYRVPIHTFHSFCNEIIQKHSDFFHFSNATQLDDINRIKIIEDLLNEIKNQNPETRLFSHAINNIYLVISSIQTLKKEGIGPEEFKTKVNEMILNLMESKSYLKGTQKSKNELEKLQKSLEFGDLYSKYQEVLMERDLYDYEDMINFVIRAFRNNDEFLALYQEQFQFIHVDEYQDTNGAQNDLIYLLGSYDDSPNIFVVGDDDQAIYRFQGANIENIFRFNVHFQNVKIIPTVQNYRSTQTILDAAETLIQNNEARLTNKIKNLSKQLLSNNSYENKPIDVLEFKDQFSENLYIAKEILRLKNNKNIPFSNIAVIYRNHEHAAELIKTLTKLNIPVNVKNFSNVWDNEYVQKFILILKALNLIDEQEDTLIYEILEMDLFNIDPILLYKIAFFAKTNKTRYLEFFTSQKLKSNFIDSLDEELKIKFQKVIEILNKLFELNKLKHNLNIVNFFETFLNDFGFLNYFQKNNMIDELRAFSQLIDYVSYNFTLNKNFDLPTFMRDLEIIEKANVQTPIIDSEDTKDAVTLTTAHSSKGLQFNHVFIIRATEQAWIKKKADSSFVPREVILNFENSLSDGLDSKLEDDRRLFYVALTRAEAHVYITYALEYIGRNGKEENYSVRFIDEINEKYLKKQKIDDVDVNIDEYIKILKPQKIKLDDRQKDYILKKISNFKISSSTLNHYIDDPIKFLREQILDFPQIPNKETAMGSAVHKALEQYNYYVAQKNLIPKDTFLNVYKQHLYKIFYGYSDYEDALKVGTENLELFYEEVKNLPFEEIAEIEYDFSAHNVYLDIPNNEPVKLTGRIDLIVYTDKELNEVKIIDYKNSISKSQNAILGKTKNSNEATLRQLVFYKLASELDQYFRPKRSLSKSKYNVVTTEIRFMKPNKQKKNNKFTYCQIDIDSKYLENLKKLIYEIVNKIRNLEFEEEYNPISLITGERI